MTEPRAHRRIAPHRKKNLVPLSKLRTSDVLKTLVDHPRRLPELLGMLEDKDRNIRGRTAAVLARLSDLHSASLRRAIPRLAEALSDDSAYVRWHVVYALGKLGYQWPARCHTFLNDLAGRLDDENRVVRTFACKALSQVAARRPEIIEEFFQNLKKDIPPSVARVLRNSKTRLNRTARS